MACTLCNSPLSNAHRVSTSFLNNESALPFRLEGGRAWYVPPADAYTPTEAAAGGAEGVVESGASAAAAPPSLDTIRYHAEASYLPLPLTPTLTSTLPYPYPYPYYPYPTPSPTPTPNPYPALGTTRRHPRAPPKRRSAPYLG